MKIIISLYWRKGVCFEVHNKYFFLKMRMGDSGVYSILNQVYWYKELWKEVFNDIIHDDGHHIWLSHSRLDRSIRSYLIKAAFLWKGTHGKKLSVMKFSWYSGIWSKVVEPEWRHPTLMNIIISLSLLYWGEKSFLLSNFHDFLESNTKDVEPE